MSALNHKNIHVVIAGAGIIGLTTAYRLKKTYPNLSISIFEKEKIVGCHASGRNSGVLHSGIYYGAKTLKAKVCAEGNQSMYDFAIEHGIPVIKKGKIIIPTQEDELPRLDRLLKNARDNNIDAYEISAEEVLEKEPFVKPYKRGVYCPSVAVIDSVAVLNQLVKCLEKMNVAFHFEQEIIEIVATEKKGMTHQGESFKYDFFINCAGAFADKIAGKFNKGGKYMLLPFKGLYYQLADEVKHYVNTSIYPVPDPEMPFLGVHFTRTVHDDVQIGPTATPALGRENYGIVRGAKFSEAAQIFIELGKLYLGHDKNFRELVHREILNYWKPHYVRQAQKLVPEVKADDFKMSTKVGIRPQLVNRDTKQLVMDFVIEEDENSIHVLNAISPAFTSSFAFANYIIDRIRNRLLP